MSLTPSMFEEPKTTFGGPLARSRPNRTSAKAIAPAKGGTSGEGRSSPVMSLPPGGRSPSSQPRASASSSRAGKVETSRTAWRNFVGERAKLDRAILQCLEDDIERGGDGLIGERIAELIGRKIQSVSGNLSHLKGKRLVVLSGSQAKTSSGYPADKLTLGPGPDAASEAVA